MPAQASARGLMLPHAYGAINRGDELFTTRSILCAEPAQVCGPDATLPCSGGTGLLRRPCSHGPSSQSFLTSSGYFRRTGFVPARRVLSPGAG
jgi:hypothetical protein